MNTTFPATYFDGRTLQPQPVTVTVTGATLRLDGLTEPVECAFDVVRISDRLGQVPRFLYLPGGGTLESPANDVIDQMLRDRTQGSAARVIHWLEQRSRIAVAATVLLVVSVSTLVYFGLPWLARRGAYAVPASIERQAGRAALASLGRIWGASNLDPVQRGQIRDALDRLLQARRIKAPVQLEFRRLGEKGPNAFALPGGIIVMSDELVALATEEEISAVLAHELGHWQKRHGLQSVLRSSAALLIVSTITGDLSTLTNFSAALPFTLLQEGYSREFESEADAYAVETLQLAGLKPAYLASILDKLGHAHPGSEQIPSYLSTHPSTADRIQKIDPTGEFRRLPAPPSAVAAETTPDPYSIPAPIHQVQPVYPATLRLQGISGKVTVSFIVNEKGDVLYPMVESASHPDFKAAALQAVYQWKYRPGRKAGQPVSVRLQTSLTFVPPSDTSTKSGEDEIHPTQKSKPQVSDPANVYHLEHLTFAEDAPDQPPVAISQPPPVYPAMLRLFGAEGEVTLRFIVDQNGQVRVPEVLKSTRTEFEEPAIAAVSQWQFKPGRKKGRPVNTRVDITLNFNLSDLPAESAGDIPQVPAEKHPDDKPRSPL